MPIQFNGKHMPIKYSKADDIYFIDIDGVIAFLKAQQEINPHDFETYQALIKTFIRCKNYIRQNCD